MFTQILTKLMAWMSHSWTPHVAETGNVADYEFNGYFDDYYEYIGFYEF